MFVCCECCVLSGRGLCDELITHPEESYRLWCIIVCDLETLRMGRPWPALGRSATRKKKCLLSCITKYRDCFILNKRCSLQWNNKVWNMRLWMLSPHSWSAEPWLKKVSGLNSPWITCYPDCLRCSSISPVSYFQSFVHFFPCDINSAEIAAFLINQSVNYSKGMFCYVALVYHGIWS